MQNNISFVLIVALITWGGVFGYLLRLNALAKSIEETVKRYENQDQA